MKSLKKVPEKVRKADGKMRGAGMAQLSDTEAASSGQMSRKNCKG